MITGKRDAITPPVNEAMYVSGLAHVLSISGYNIFVLPHEAAGAAQALQFRYDLCISTCGIVVGEGTGKQEAASPYASQKQHVRSPWEARGARRCRLTKGRGGRPSFGRPGKADYTEWDDDPARFPASRMRGGSKKWDCQYRVNGKQRRESRATFARSAWRTPARSPASASPRSSSAPPGGGAGTGSRSGADFGGGD